MAELVTLAHGAGLGAGWVRGSVATLFLAIGRRYDDRMALATERIEISPAVMLGKPIIRGTRITVELI